MVIKEILKVLFSFIPWLFNFSDLPNYGSNTRKRYTLRLLSKCLVRSTLIQKLAPGFKNHMRNLDNFRQTVERPKSWNSMGYICLKPTFLQLKHVHKIFLTTFNYLCENSPNSLCRFWNQKSFFTTLLIYIILAQTLHIFHKNIPYKFKFSGFSLLNLKFIKFLVSFFK